MKNFRQLIFALTLIFAFSAQAQEKTITLNDSFDKIIVSPHIEVDFVQGSEASIVVNDINEPIDKFNYEIKGGTLQVYMEGAKTSTKHEKVNDDGWKHKVPIYKNTVARITITYTDVNVFSLRGEEKITFNSPLKQDELTLRIYGELEVTIGEVELGDLKVSIYGDSDLVIERGNIDKQRITAYGESTVSSGNVESKEAKVTSYGDGTFKFNVANRLKVTSYGEADIRYKGDPEIKKGIILGESSISKI